MVMRKNYFPLRLLFLFIIFSCSQKHTVVKERAGLVFKAEIGNWHREEEYNYLSIKTILINNSPEPIKYVNMYCDSDIIYVIETKRLNIHFRDCDKNSDKLHILPPYQNEQSVLEARTQEDTSKLIGEKFRVGFNYVKPRSNDDFASILDSLRNQKHLIWSDTVEIK
jgi:hypothetical protein